MQIAATVGLSLGLPPDTPAEQVEEDAGLAASGRGPRRGRILVMDDDRMVRETLIRHLRICGYEVEATACGESAVGVYRRALEAGRPFDAVILDLMVKGGWGGEQALAELLLFDPGVRALVCSGTLAGSRASYEKKGFRGVLEKPFTLAELRQGVEAVLLPAAGG